MCWADKIGAVWAFIAYAGLLLISNDKGAALAFFVSGEGLKYALIVAFSPWIFLRFVDLILGGPQRRKGWIKVQAIDR